MSSELFHVLPVGLEPAYPLEPSAGEAFLHLCTAEQLEGVLRRFFKGGPAQGLILNVERLEGELRWEDTYGHGLFPHLYGSIPEAAVVEVRRVTAT